MVGLSHENRFKFIHRLVVGFGLLACVATPVLARAAAPFSAPSTAAQPPIVISSIKKSESKPVKKSSVKTEPLSSEILFEGYSKIMMGQTYIGYTIQRFEFDAKRKEYSTVYYLKTQPPANDVIESLKARSTFDLRPLSYQYTELASGKVHTVDAAFSNGLMTVTELSGGKRTTSAPKKVPPGTFLASFLGYLMLQQKDAVKISNKYSYQAIAEEDGGIYKGDAFVKSQDTTKGISTFKILNTYKGVQFVSHMTPQGEVLATESAAQGISTELVPNIQEATKGMSVNSNQLAQLFGSVPKGQDNALSRHSVGEPLGGASLGSAPAPAPTPEKSKQEILDGSRPTQRSKTDGVPQGEGIEVKPQNTPSN